MKKFIRNIALIAFCVLMLAGTCVPTLAASYTTYTYSIDGWYMESPDAYTPDRKVDSAYMGLLTPIDDPRDLVVDSDGNVYIVDGTNNRVVVLDPYYKVKFEIQQFINDQGVNDTFLSPSGVYVTDDHIYVCDTDNNRIVLFDKEGNFVRRFEEPDSDVFPEGSIYKPVAIAVAQSGYMYVISSTTYMGVIALNAEGEFTGFVGAQKVSYNLWEILWRRFQTDAQRLSTKQNVSTEYNNITIDDRGFIYVTTSTIDEANQQGAITAKSKDGAYAPVKRLNTSGEDILKRNGFYPPSGEVDVATEGIGDITITGPSKIIDVALGPEGSWSIIDEKRGKIFTYDQDGKLLFIFGDLGTQLGNFQSIEAIAYQDDKILVLDKTADCITVFRRTEYGNLLISALENYNNRNYDQAAMYWEKILQRNTNFDAAYVGVGKAYYRDGNWEKAMEYYQYAYDTVNYSEAFQEYRKELVAKYILLIPVVVVVLCVGIVMFFKFAAKVNRRVAVEKRKKHFGHEILYAFHIIFHPFDGFWDLKHEKRGSLRGALFYIALLIVAFTYQSVGQGYIFNPYGDYTSIIWQIISVALPILLWCVANWCFTTLFDGEGSFKDIFIATGYATLPLTLMIIPATIATNLVTATGAGIISLLLGLGWVWTGLLLFFGMMVTHDYTMFKNIITAVISIVGMAFIMFIGVLFSSLVNKIISFVSNIIIELSYRM